MHKYKFIYLRAYVKHFKFYNIANFNKKIKNKKNLKQTNQLKEKIQNLKKKISLQNWIKW